MKPIWHHWLGQLSGFFHRRPLPPSHRRRSPVLERLEDRTVLSATAFVPGQVIVKFQADVTPMARMAALAQTGASAVEDFQTDTMRAQGDPGLTLLHGVSDVAAVARELRSIPGVVYAQPNWLTTATEVANDTYYTSGQLWGMYSDDLPIAAGPLGTTNAFGSQAEEAWLAGRIGSNQVYVGIIDEGVQYTHPDLSANVWTNPFDPADGIDNDGNGYVDDINGWDFYNDDNTVYDGTGDDHGTHVAGTIAARGGNGIGVAGVAWNVTYIPAKFLGPGGGSTLDAINALDYLTDLKSRHGLNIVATNNSWGGGGFSQALLDAIDRAAQQNILFIAAAGNGGFDGVGDNNDLIPFYPASYTHPNIIAVASITSTGARSSFSNYGANSVDLGAPGSSILSTVPNGTYATYSGTSMATPHVTGAAALYASANPGATALQIKNAILSTATPTSSLSGITVTGGRLNVSALLAASSGPTLSINDVTLAEGNSGTTSFTFTVTLSSASSQTVTVQYATANGSATASSDYTAVPLTTLTFSPGQTTKMVTVLVNGDTTFEANETFFVNLSNATGATLADNQGMGTIQNDDAALLPSISINDVSKAEGKRNRTTPFTFTVSLSSSSTQTITVSYTTASGTATTVDNDYTSTSGTLTFNPGQTSQTITVSVRGDSRVEPDETFFVNLSNPTNATLGDGQGQGTILNDDGTSGPGGASIPDGTGAGPAQPAPVLFGIPATSFVPFLAFEATLQGTPATDTAASLDRVAVSVVQALLVDRWVGEDAFWMRQFAPSDPAGTADQDESPSRDGALLAAMTRDDSLFALTSTNSLGDERDESRLGRHDLDVLFLEPVLDPRFREAGDPALMAE